MERIAQTWLPADLAEAYNEALARSRDPLVVTIESGAIYVTGGWSAERADLLALAGSVMAVRVAPFLEAALLDAARTSSPVVIPPNDVPPEVEAQHVRDAANALNADAAQHYLTVRELVLQRYETRIDRRLWRLADVGLQR